MSASDSQPSDSSPRSATSARAEISRDDCFDLLSNHRRRYTLHYLQHNGDDATLGELADQIAAWENGIPQEEVSYDQRKRVYTSLQQVHLPRMDKYGVVRFDEREGHVEPGPAVADLDVYLEVVQGRDVPWSVFYAALAVLNAVLIALVTLSVPPFTLFSQTGLPVFVVTTFFFTAVAHTYVTRTEMQIGQTERPPELERE